MVKKYRKAYCKNCRRNRSHYVNGGCRTCRKKWRTTWIARNPLKNTWGGMIARCYSPKSINYSLYGGRGIRVCKRWRESYEAFVEDVGPRPTGMTIDRIDNDGDYGPGNVRWATKKEQSRNRRNNRLITAFGETKSSVEWVEDLRCKVGRTTFEERIKRGWNTDRALSEPCDVYRRIPQLRRREKVRNLWPSCSKAEIARRLGVSWQTIFWDVKAIEEGNKK